MKVLAVDVGGSHVSCGAVEDQRLLDVISIENDSRGKLINLLPNLAEALNDLAKRHGGGFAGIGFGFCGLVDTAASRVVSTNHKYSDATSVDLTRWAREQLNLPLILENDTRMALLGERHAGVGIGSNDAVMITLGTGVGTAAIMEGTLVRGRHFQAGCLGGHFTIDIDGRVCSCGGRGCFEAEASTYALPGVCKTWTGFETSSLSLEKTLDFARLFHWADQGDPVATQIRARCVKIWAACALSLVHAYDPELVILGGGVMKSSFPILNALREHVDSYAWTPWGQVQFRAAALGSNAALIGALPLFQLQR
jgi:glucokinase